MFDDFDINDYTTSSAATSATTVVAKKQKYYPLYKNYPNGSEEYYKRIVEEDEIWENKKILFLCNNLFFKDPLFKKLSSMKCRVWNQKSKDVCETFKFDLIIAVGGAAKAGVTIAENTPLILINPDNDFFINEDVKPNIKILKMKNVHKQLKETIKFLEDIC